jgi:hypothetical protein
MILFKVRLHRAHVELRILVADLAGEKWRGPAHDPCLVLKRAEDAPAPRALVDVALDLHRPVGGLVLFRIAPARGQLDLTDTYRTAISVETLQRLLGGAATDRVAGLLDRCFHLQQSSVERHRHLNRHLVTRPPDYLRHNCTFFNLHRRLQDTPRRYIMSRPHPRNQGERA